MKKLITTIAFIALSTVSAKAIDFETFSLTGGIATNNSVWGATATQDEYNAGGTAIDASNKQSGVFTESFGSQFVELGIGRYISLGFEHVPIQYLHLKMSTQVVVYQQQVILQKFRLTLMT